MRHGLAMEGPAFRLRPVRLYDAAFIVQLRSDPERARYLHPGATDVPSQERWLRDYFDRSGDYYFVIEHRATGVREGTAGIYNTDPEAKSAEWGRWILRRGSFAAVESACLVYRLGFEALGLDSMYCRTIVDNASALAFHDSFGVQRAHRLPRYFKHEGRMLDAVEGRLTRKRWMTLRDNLESKAARAAASWSVPA